MSKPKLLSDAEVQEFIVNGFIVIQPDVDPTLHASIDRQLQNAWENESWYGNNITSRVPDLHRIVRSPRVDGAITSLAGPGYINHPHRAMHVSTPVEDATLDYAADANAPPMGKGSIAGSGWHQDAHSPLSRARHHHPRFLIGFYFPHDTPRVMGPTRVQAGSHLYSQPVEPHAVVLPEILPAGSFVLVHFDMVHAAFPNRSDRTRFMVKFVFARTRHPTEASWDHIDADWQRPAAGLVGYDLTPAWQATWNWMRGVPIETDGTAPIDQPWPDPRDQVARLKTIYSFPHDQETIERLCERLLTNAGKDKHRRVLAKNREGEPVPRDDTAGFPRCWNERAIVMEDEAYALTAMGAAVVTTVAALCEHDDPWIQINAAFVLGELGPDAANALPALVGLLRSPVSAVVRQALDAIGSLGVDIASALDEIERLLKTTHDDWQEAQVTRGWVDADQVRLNAAFALANAVTVGGFDAAIADRIEGLMIDSLDDPNGYVGAVAADGLKRMKSPSAIDAAFQYLTDRRWDESLSKRKPF